MLPIPREELIRRVQLENPWWESGEIDEERNAMPKRKYFDLFFPNVQVRLPRRALILMGPRRVGKTVILHQSIKQLISDGVDPKRIFYVDLQTPLFNGLSLEHLLLLCKEATEAGTDEVYIFFDEIQYLREWEVHLKNLVDVYTKTKFIASGSAAAALRLKSAESGAGRFTDFLLPPVTFYEYLSFVNADDLFTVKELSNGGVNIDWTEIEKINKQFVDYLNFGGYPEAIFIESIQQHPERYIKSDIIDKVLMKDLPSLYGISDIQELNSLFTMLAYNTGNEVSLDGLASKSNGASKNTIKKYIEYLESAFLLKTVSRIDQNAKTFARMNYFKIYLTNPCMRSALFGALKDDDPTIGHLVETAIFSQTFHSIEDTQYYARWKGGKGEVDLVTLSPKDLKPTFSVEVGWTDSHDTKSYVSFLSKHPQCQAFLTTKTLYDKLKIGTIEIDLIPSSVYAFYVGWNIINQKKRGEISISAFGECST